MIRARSCAHSILPRKASLKRQRRQSRAPHPRFPITTLFVDLLDWVPAFTPSPSFTMKTPMERWTPTSWAFRAKALGHPTTSKGTSVLQNSMLLLFVFRVAVSISKSPSRIYRRKKHGAFLLESAALYFQWLQRNRRSCNVGRLLCHQ